MIITASIVAYNNNVEEISDAIKSILLYGQCNQVYVIDNSLVDDLQIVSGLNDNIVYIHNPSNPGFGAAHNIAINFAVKQGSMYHFIVNPDVYFDHDIISPMVNYMEQNQQVGMMMPKILNPDRSIQYLPKLLPSPLAIIWRKVKFPKGLYNKFIDLYELRSAPHDTIQKVPIISGCFTLLRLQAIEEVGGYDDDFFMYFEDWDLSRRIAKKFDTVYFPKVSVYHKYESGANKKFKLFKFFLQSAVMYFNKWGWFIDRERIRINKETLAQFK